MHDDHHRTNPHHGHSLADDLTLIAARMAADRPHRHRMQRRRALAWIASSAGSTLLQACGGGGESSSSTPAAVAATTVTSTTTTTSSTCIADPTETAGPFPGDGSNTSAGVTSDILTASGIVRSDIRASFIGSSTSVAPGVAMTLTLTLVNTNAVCSTLQGYAIYLWHCDRSGNYSLYGAPNESYLRGVQVTDSSGRATFTSIVPACYSGRYPHLHFEVFANLAAATAGRNAVLTSQLALPAAVANVVYANADGYGQSVANFSQVSLATDNVFGDDTAAQIAAMTPLMSGSVADGFTATATIGIAR